MESPVYYGNSMRRVFVPGERLLLEKVDFADLQVGDVVTVIGAAQHQYVHRIIEKYPDHAVTQGDNNLQADKDHLTADCYFRRVTAAVSRNGGVRSITNGSCGMKNFMRNQRKMQFRRRLGSIFRRWEKCFFWRIKLTDFQQFGSEKCYNFCTRPVARVTADGGIGYARWYYRLLFKVPAADAGKKSGNFPQKNKKLIDPLLLDFMRESLWKTAGSWYQNLEPEKQEKLLLLARAGKLEPLVFWSLHEFLPPEVRGDFQRIYQSHSIAALKNKVAMTALSALFEEEKIRFAAIKGMDLAYRCYPEAALRSFCDWDILLHPEDQLRALEVLKKHNWVIPMGFELPDEHHHYPVHCKDNIYLEPHKTLSHFDRVDPLMIWAHCRPLRPGSMEHVLSNELRMLLLCRHASGNNYRHIPWTKLLLDAVCIGQKGVDWRLLKELSRQWSLPYPGDLLAVWNEFFPGDWLEAMAPDLLQTKQIKNMLDMQRSVAHVTKTEWVVSQRKDNAFLFIIKHIKYMRPGNLRRKYNLPEKGAFIRMIWFYTYDMSVKCVKFFRYMLFPSRGVEDYRSMVEEVEKRDRDQQ